MAVDVISQRYAAFCFYALGKCSISTQRGKTEQLHFTTSRHGFGNLLHIHNTVFEIYSRLDIFFWSLPW